MTNANPPLPPEELDEPVNDAEDEPIEATAGEEKSAPAPRPAPPLPSSEPAPPPPPQAPAAPTVTYRYDDPLAKSPGLALFLSILFPGLGVGHLYAGSYERALMILGTIGVLVSTGVVINGYIWVPIGFAIAFVVFFAMFDAYREAQIANLAADEELPKPRRQAQGRLMFGVFLIVVGSIVIADKFDLFDRDWFYEWWPVLVLLIGVYFIGSWIWEKMKASENKEDSSFD